MATHRIKEGLDIPIAGAPAETLTDAPEPTFVGIVADDYLGMKPTLMVEQGDCVKRGQPLFEDAKRPGLFQTAVAAGTVATIYRGAKRALQSLVIELNDRERAGALTGEDYHVFPRHDGRPVIELSGEDVRALIIASGLWTALRARPYSQQPPLNAEPHSIFVTAMDSNPLAPSIDLVVAGREDDLNAGLTALWKLGACPVFLCKDPQTRLQPSLPPEVDVRVETFSGPHPSGTVGLHIHRLDPVSRRKSVWHIGLQDVLTMGKFFLTGHLDLTRVVSLAGPSVVNPRHIRTRRGAFIDELVAGELHPGEHRVLSGSVFNGRPAVGPILGYLGRYHQQITALPEGGSRPLLGWTLPGFNRFSVARVFMSTLLGNRRCEFTTDTYGSRRAMVPMGFYERVFPLDILPTFLLRAILTQDLDRAEELGVLELDEEDLALCTFVCPGKQDYAPALRQVLTTLEKEG